MLILASVHHVRSGIAGVVIGALAILLAHTWHSNNRMVSSWLSGLFGRPGGRVALSAMIAVTDLLGIAMIVLGILSIAGVV